MRKRIVWHGLALAAVFFPVLAWQDAPAPEPKAVPKLEVARAVACLEVKDRQPESIDTVFSNQAQQIYCYTQIEGAPEPTQIEHVWIHEGEEIAKVTLPVRGSPWRTWSSKKMLPEWTGSWKVEVRDASGSVLKTVEFSVTKGEPPAPESGKPGEPAPEGGSPN